MLSHLEISNFFQSSPSEGNSAVTKFRIICRNWENKDPPTRYEFRYDNGRKDDVILSSAPKKELPLWYSGEVGTNKPSFLPTGDPEDDFKIRFKIRIENDYGAYATFDKLYVKVSAILLRIFNYS